MLGNKLRKTPKIGHEFGGIFGRHSLGDILYEDIRL